MISKKYLAQGLVASQLILSTSLSHAFIFEYEVDGSKQRYDIDFVQGSYTGLFDQLNSQPWISSIPITGGDYPTQNEEAQMNFAGSLLQATALSDLTKNILNVEWKPFVYILSYPRLDPNDSVGTRTVYGQQSTGSSGPVYINDDGSIRGSSIGGFSIDGNYYWFIGTLLPGPFGPSAEDTLASMQPNASAMKNAFNSQYATLAYGLNHDCTIFDTNGVCVSVFGRNTSLNDYTNDNNAAGLVLGYKPHAQLRVGTYIDQSLNSNTTAGVRVERSNPDVGLFGVWNMNADGSGLELRAATNYSKRDLNVNRSVVGDSSAEAGSGRSDLNAYGALFEASFAYGLNDNWSAKPYAGVRYLSIKRDGYSEGSTVAVESPLSYSGLKQETTSALVGVRFNGRLAHKLMASFNAGFEHDLNHSINDYRATGVDDLGSINMDSQKDRTRPTAGLGISYDVAEKQRLSANVQYRKEIFMSESSTTGQINYTIGF